MSSAPLEPTAPGPSDVLRWCAAAAPGLWFPSAHAASTGTPRDAIDDPLWRLRQAGLVQVGDWVKGRGQGFALTPAGTDALADPAKLAVAANPPPPPPVIDVPPAVPPDPNAPPPRPSELTRFDRGEMARQAVLAPRRAVVTPVLVVVCVVWFLVQLAVARQTGGSIEHLLADGDAAAATRVGAVDGHHVALGQWWRLLTAGFVHKGAVQLVLTMLLLGMTGPAVEDLWGRWRFGVIFLVAGLTGSCATIALRPDAVFAGASGGICGLLGSAIVWAARYREHVPEDDFDRWVRRLILVIAVCVVASLLPGVSWQAHLGGALGGAAAAAGLDLARKGNGRRQIAGWVGVGLAVAAGPAGLLAAMRFAPAWHPTPTGPGRVLHVPDGTPIATAYWAVTKALISQSPGTLAAARERLADLRTAGGDAAAFAAEAEARLTSGRVPTDEEWAALKAKAKAAGWAGRP